ncbi:dihydropteroate synthase-related protein [Methanofollis liminatans DSM 4140]|jgi:dihydropteroate synthase-like protein|uniref:Dihydropteroate synthase-related protein n=1 Tax=Methanofollis liminatans DSM 4140 TaxID=28892 RepID=J0S647_9EURY|nr:dihydropteroate synthase-like protein [Methanofollis liminatans]EJG05994.1 dihydropteroate synthase-related protein [Methanofollis liminatans DSM 4140]
MRILLPTGSLTADIVRKAADGYDAEVVVAGEIAAFLTPADLKRMISAGAYDMVIVSGMSTASFASVEEETGVPVYRGPRHAADLGMILPLAGKIPLSRTVPADELFAAERREAAFRRLAEVEEKAEPEFVIRGTKIGGGSRMKVLAEIMDAHRHPALRETVEEHFRRGADIVDLGFGFDAAPEDVERCFAALDGIDRPLAADTQDPALIRAALCRADLILSLHEGNIPAIGHDVAAAGAAAVIVPGDAGLDANLKAAEAAGIAALIADPLLQPAGSGFVASLGNFSGASRPLFFGAGNVVELLDADSVGANALLAACAHEVGAAVIFTSEHSDKTRGSVAEMRRATEMMAVMGDHPYPKDLGIDLFVLKEKRRRREPGPEGERLDAPPAPEGFIPDPAGNLRIAIEEGWILVGHKGRVFWGRTAADLAAALVENGCVSRLDHAAYLGRELARAETALLLGRSYVQDGRF